MANKLISELTGVSVVTNQDEVEVQKAGEYTTKRATVLQLTAQEAAERATQDDIIEGAVGLSTLGTYPSLTNSWYLRAAEFTAGVTDRDGATGALTENVLNAIRILDARTYEATVNAALTNIIRTVKVTLSTAEIWALNANPKSLLPDLGSGFIYEIISAVGINNFGTAAFEAGSAKLEIKYSGGDTMFEFDNTFIEAGAAVVHRAIPTTSFVMSAASVVAYCGTVPTPATGDGSIDIILTYRFVY